MLRVGLSASVLFALLSWMSPAGAAPVGTRDEAVAMVHRVQRMFKTAGADTTFRAVTAKIREFNDRDLYPFIYTLKGVNVAHGSRPELVGKDLIDFRDQNGEFLIRDMIDVATGTGSGWVDYRWTNPKTRVVEDKSAYIEKMGPYLVGVGVYQGEPSTDNTIAIISGSPNSDDTSLRMAYDLAGVLGDGENLRILPIVGTGSSRGIRDVRSQRGIDLAITETNILNNFRGSNEQLGSVDNKVVYVTKLFNEELHLVARADITSVEQLRGLKVNLDEKGSGTRYTMRDVLKRLDIQVEEVRLTQAEAFVKLARGEIAATALLAGKPSRTMVGLPKGLHFLSIPYSTGMGEDYLPARLGSEDYPELIPSGEAVDTVAVGTVLIAYNWPKNTDRYRRIEKFVTTFFPRIGDFREPPSHVKWREVNLAAKIPGWTRFEAAEAWLNGVRVQAAAAPPVPAAPAGTPDQQSQFQSFLAARGISAGPEMQEQLFKEFLKWNTRRPVTR